MDKNFPRPTMMLILDGFGHNEETRGNAIAQARTPNLDEIFRKYPRTTIQASGMSVGLPDGQMGNSEVGHLNIGAGRIVYQDLTEISKAIDDGVFSKNPVLLAAIEHSKKHNGALHLLGLLSDGGVHSHLTHLLALIDMAREHSLEKLYIHCALDGRDVPPRSALTYFEQLEAHIAKTGTGRIATVSGRYYAMDRDKRWERVVKEYEAMTLGEGMTAASAADAVNAAYERDENDEFVKPTVIMKPGEPPCTVNDGDAVIMFNFRPDRAREITRAFVDDGFDGFERKKRPKNLHYVCMTQYDAEMPNVSVAFPPRSLDNTLGEYISGLGLSQLRIAETEKYAHVTFFFNGGVEEPNKGEDRVLIPSPTVATYDLQPEMSAYKVTDKALEIIDEGKYDVIILNFANADMVGHTGFMDAAIKAIEALDACVPRITDAILKKGGQVLLTADHGNADYMEDAQGNVVTAHSTNPVPLVNISESPKGLREGGILADLAPTLLDLMNLPIPAEMEGKSLIR